MPIIAADRERKFPSKEMTNLDKEKLTLNVNDDDDVYIWRLKILKINISMLTYSRTF